MTPVTNWEFWLSPHFSLNPISLPNYILVHMMNKLDHNDFLVGLIHSRYKKDKHFNPNSKMQKFKLQIHTLPKKYTKNQDS